MGGGRGERGEVKGAFARTVKACSIKWCVEGVIKTVGSEHTTSAAESLSQ